MKVIELYSDESKWAKNSYAYSEDGRKVASFNENACKWCLAGAITKCYSSDAYAIRVVVRKAIRKLFGDKWDEKNLCEEFRTNEVMFNDDPETTFEQVMAVLMEAGV